MTRSCCYILTVQDQFDIWKQWNPSESIRCVRLEEVETDCKRYLKGYVVFKSRTRFNTAMKALPGEAHIETSKMDDAVKLYSQENRLHDGILIEHGTLLDRGERLRFGKHAKREGISYGDAAASLTEVNRRKWDVVQKFMDGTPLRNILTEYPGLMTGNFNTFESIAKRVQMEEDQTEMKERAEAVTLRQWQQTLDNELNQKADDRKLIVYLDYRGNAGKSFYIRNRMDRFPNTTGLVTNAKTESMLHIASKFIQPDVIFFDLYKCMGGDNDIINYGCIEAIKNGTFISPKYDSHVIRWKKCPHVVIMTNNQLKWSMMSLDRWDVRELVLEGDEVHCKHVCTYNLLDATKNCTNNTSCLSQRFSS